MLVLVYCHKCTTCYRFFFLLKIYSRYRSCACWSIMQVPPIVKNRFSLTFNFYWHVYPSKLCPVSHTEFINIYTNPFKPIYLVNKWVCDHVIWLALEWKSYLYKETSEKEISFTLESANITNVGKKNHKIYKTCFKLLKCLSSMLNVLK